MSNVDWIRVTKSKPCPICKRPNGGHASKWCSLLRDGRGVRCMFVESKYPSSGGYMHWFDNQTNGKTVAHAKHTPISKVTDFAYLAENYCKATTDARVTALAKELGLTFEAIRLMRTGFDGQAYTMPMRDLAGKITGIQRRYPDGVKITEGKAGFFLPRNLNGESPLWISEGWSDTAALCSVGLPVAGLYNAGWAPDKTIQLLQGRKAIIVADNDGYAERGHIGGRIRTGRFAKALRAASIRVQILHPPKGIKDAREWVNAGATKETFMEAIR